MAMIWVLIAIVVVTLLSAVAVTVRVHEAVRRNRVALDGLRRSIADGIGRLRAGA